jgi:uncharacterized membrane protein YccF (DUF307 family)
VAPAARGIARDGARCEDRPIMNTLLNVIWFVLEHLVTGVLMCLTIIGIPLGIANFKLIAVSLAPLGKEIVDA